MEVRLTGAEQISEGGDIQRDGAGRIDLHALARADQKRDGRGRVANRLAQGGQGHAQATASGGGCLAGPEELGQRITAVRARFDGQIGQQRTDLGVGQAGDRLIVQRHLEWP